MALRPIEQEFRKAKILCKWNKEVRPTKSKSYAQVESLVRPQAAEQNSCGLKPRRKRPHRIMGRFSEAEREIVHVKAKKANLSINKYVRMMLLGPSLVPHIDPAIKPVLLDLYRELARQGNNLNQIARKLNTRGTYSEMVLMELFDSLLFAQQAVSDTLTRGHIKD